MHSCRLVDTREEAEAFPRGTLRLGLCTGCGFITNTAYEPELQSYFESYEETQGFSPRFSEFAHELAQRWVDRYELQGKGRARDRLRQGRVPAAPVRAHGAGRGVGVDPSIVSERLTSSAAERVAFIRDLYDERYAHLVGDAVVCRHTLEHIHPVADFLRMIRRSLDSRPDTAVLFELPDVLRVLRECAFWDVYYEHCSYFTPGSLARLFRASGFEVLAVELDYDDQYILVEALPGGDDRVPLPIEEQPEDVANAVTEFTRNLTAVQERWRAELRSVRSRGGTTVVWGSGSKGVSFLTTLGLGDEVSLVVDINPFKQGKYMAGTGHEIVAPAALRTLQPDLVIAMNPVYREEIQRELDTLELDARLEAV